MQIFYCFYQLINTHTHTHTAGVENIVKIHTTDDDDDVYVGVFLNISSMPQVSVV